MAAQPDNGLIPAVQGGEPLDGDSQPASSAVLSVASSAGAALPTLSSSSIALPVPALATPSPSPSAGEFEDGDPLPKGSGPKDTGKVTGKASPTQLF
jgi:hypothetical protein